MPALAGHLDSVYCIAYAPDGRRLVSAGKDRSVIVWNVSFESWQSRACRIANRNMTRAEWDQFIGSDVPYQKSCPDLPLGAGVRK